MRVAPGHSTILTILDFYPRKGRCEIHATAVDAFRIRGTRNTETALPRRDAESEGLLSFEVIQGEHASAA